MGVNNDGDWLLSDGSLELGHRVWSDDGEVFDAYFTLGLVIFAWVSNFCCVWVIRLEHAIVVLKIAVGPYWITTIAILIAPITLQKLLFGEFVEGVVFVLKGEAALHRTNSGEGPA